MSTFDGRQSAPEAVRQAADLFLEDDLLRERQTGSAPFHREVGREETRVDEELTNRALEVGRHVIVGFVDRELVRNQRRDQLSTQLSNLQLTRRQCEEQGRAPVLVSQQNDGDQPGPLRPDSAMNGASRGCTQRCSSE